MVPFSFPRPLLKSRVMNKYISSSATVGVWAPGPWGWELDVFILSCVPAFLILISVPVFPSFSSVFKNRGPASRWSRWLMAAQRKAKLPNEPNLEMPFPAKTLAISHFHLFSKQVKNGKKVSILRSFHAISDRLWGIYRSETAILRLWRTVVKKWGPWCRSSTVTLVKTQKRLNEPNSKNANPQLNINDFTNFDFFKK